MQIKSRIRDLSSQLKCKDEPQVNTPKKIRSGKDTKSNTMKNPPENKDKSTSGKKSKSTGNGSEI